MKELPLTRGFRALVDDEDHAWLSRWKWTYLKGYAVRRQRIGPRRENKGQWVYMHREVLGLSRDDPKKCDHINRVRHDNRRSNLRAVDHAQNCNNVAKKRFVRGTTSRFKGVSRVSRGSGRWRARLKIGPKEIPLGAFETEEEAAITYDCAAPLFVGPTVCVNGILP